MADQERDSGVRENTESAYIGQDIPNNPSDYREEVSAETALVPVVNKTGNQSNNKEETAAEIAAPVPVSLRRNQNQGRTDAGAGNQTMAGAGIGYVALALSILSLFVLPILFGAAGIVLGFIARGRGATGLGAWAIGIGVVSIIIGIFILPFF